MKPDLRELQKELKKSNGWVTYTCLDHHFKAWHGLYLTKTVAAGACYSVFKHNPHANLVQLKQVQVY